ncbi:hypothetical protein GQ42DRAFT_177452 [Ramicandelaber brevisporus]|nr:hypothetical protein GQ42DRAFT_177452 [Ramicandelaber brevisporus]
MDIASEFASKHAALLVRLISDGGDPVLLLNKAGVILNATGAANAVFSTGIHNANSNVDNSGGDVETHNADSLNGIELMQLVHPEDVEHLEDAMNQAAERPANASELCGARVIGDDDNGNDDEVSVVDIVLRMRTKQAQSADGWEMQYVHGRAVYGLFDEQFDGMSNSNSIDNNNSNGKIEEDNKEEERQINFVLTFQQYTNSISCCINELAALHLEHEMLRKEFLAMGGTQDELIALIGPALTASSPASSSPSIAQSNSIPTAIAIHTIATTANTNTTTATTVANTSNEREHEQSGRLPIPIPSRVAKQPSHNPLSVDTAAAASTSRPIATYGIPTSPNTITTPTQSNSRKFTLKTTQQQSMVTSPSTVHPPGSPIDATAVYQDSKAAPKRRRVRKPAESSLCHECGTTQSPEWRKGPAGPKTLCNACGLRYAKVLKSTGDQAPDLTRVPAPKKAGNGNAKNQKQSQSQSQLQQSSLPLPHQTTAVSLRPDVIPVLPLAQQQQQQRRQPQVRNHAHTLVDEQRFSAASPAKQLRAPSGLDDLQSAPARSVHTVASQPPSQQSGGRPRKQRILEGEGSSPQSASVSMSLSPAQAAVPSPLIMSNGGGGGGREVLPAQPSSSSAHQQAIRSSLSTLPESPSSRQCGFASDMVFPNAKTMVTALNSMMEQLLNDHGVKSKQYGVVKKLGKKDWDIVYRVGDIVRLTLDSPADCWTLVRIVDIGSDDVLTLQRVNIFSSDSDSSSSGDILLFMDSDRLMPCFKRLQELAQYKAHAVEKRRAYAAVSTTSSSYEYMDANSSVDFTRQQRQQHKQQQQQEQTDSLTLSQQQHENMTIREYRLIYCAGDGVRLQLLNDEWISATVVRCREVSVLVSIPPIETSDDIMRPQSPSITYEWLPLNSRRLQPSSTSLKRLTLSREQQQQIIEHAQQLEHKVSDLPALPAASSHGPSLENDKCHELDGSLYQSILHLFHTRLPRDCSSQVSTNEPVCEVCSLILRHRRYYCTGCEPSPSPSPSSSSASASTKQHQPPNNTRARPFNLCFICYIHAFPENHPHPRSSFATQLVLSSANFKLLERDPIARIHKMASKQTLGRNRSSLQARLGDVQFYERDYFDLGNNNGSTTMNDQPEYSVDVAKRCAFCEESDEECLGPFLPYPFLVNSSVNLALIIAAKGGSPLPDGGADSGVLKNMAPRTGLGGISSRNFWVHDACARFSPEVYVSPSGDWYNVNIALIRGRHTACFFCKTRGATVSCCDGKCSRVYHVGCTGRPLQMLADGAIFLCPTHNLQYDAHDNYVDVYTCDHCGVNLNKGRVSRIESIVSSTVKDASRPHSETTAESEYWFTCRECINYFESFDLCVRCFRESFDDIGHKHPYLSFAKWSLADTLSNEPRSIPLDFDDQSNISSNISSSRVVSKMKRGLAVLAASETLTKSVASSDTTGCDSVIPNSSAISEVLGVVKSSLGHHKRGAHSNSPASVPGADYSTVSTRCAYCWRTDSSEWRYVYNNVRICDDCFMLNPDASPMGNESVNAASVTDSRMDSMDSKGDLNQRGGASTYSPYPFRSSKSQLPSDMLILTETGPRPSQYFSLGFDSSYYDIPDHTPRWATHSGSDYRGTWLPQVVRRNLLRYTLPDERVLSNFLGRGTDAIECFLNNRLCIGIDISPAATALATKNCSFGLPRHSYINAKNRSVVLQGDARDLHKMATLFDDESFDHVLSHPPYKDCIAYSNMDGDLSRIPDHAQFQVEMAKVAQESWRVLKPGRWLTLGIGDNRKNTFYVDVGLETLRTYISAGFELEELIVKRLRDNHEFGRGTFLSVKHDFLLLTHEFIFTLRKPLRLSNTANHQMDLPPIEMVPVTARYKTQCERRQIPRATVERQSVFMGTVWVFRPEPHTCHTLQSLCISRLVERFGRNDSAWELIQLQPVSTESSISSSSLLLSTDSCPDKDVSLTPDNNYDAYADSEYERKRQTRIRSNEHALFTLGFASELGKHENDIKYYDRLMNEPVISSAALPLSLVVIPHLSWSSWSTEMDVAAYQHAIVSIVSTAFVQLAPSGLLIVGTQDIRQSSSKLWPMGMLVREDINNAIPSSRLRLKELVIAVPDGYQKNRNMAIDLAAFTHVNEPCILTDPEHCQPFPIVHTYYLIFMKFS